MVSDSELNHVFGALADPTRRVILEQLTRGGATVGELAQPFEMSRPAVSKHLRVLERAGLVERTIDGRITRCTLSAGPMRNASEWVETYREYWDDQLDRFKRYLETPAPIDPQSALQLTRVVNVDPAEAFDAWTRPEHIRRWSCPADHTVSDSKVDLTVGGVYKLQMQGPEGDTHTARGIYREIDPPRRLVYTWDWDEEGDHMGETLVTVEFRAHPSGTEIIITHEALPTPELTEEHLMGWTSCLDGLERYAASMATHSPEPS